MAPEIEGMLYETFDSITWGLVIFSNVLFVHVSFWSVYINILYFAFVLHQVAWIISN